MPTSQMNVRIDDDIRIKGNAAFDCVGWSPSQAARELWGFAARNRRNPRKIRELQRFLQEEEIEQQKTSLAEAGPHILEELRTELGINPNTFDERLSYDELREMTLLDRLEERNLL